MSVPWYLMAKGKGGGGYKTASGPIVSVNDALAAPLRSLVANIDPVQEGTGDPSPYNVRPISGWSAVNVWVEPTYDPTENPTATIQLGQTVYGGTLDVTNGVLTVDRGIYIPTGNESSYTQQTGRVAFALPNDFRVPGTVERICSDFKILTASTYCYVYTTLTPDELKTYFQQNTVQMVLGLATPITIQLTSTEISTLQGQNNVWADSGDVTVEYLSSGGTDPDLMKLAVAFMGRK